MFRPGHEALGKADDYLLKGALVSFSSLPNQEQIRVARLSIGDRTVNIKAIEYRRRADECIRKAAAAADVKDAREYYCLAIQWRMLADQIESDGQHSVRH